MKRTTRARLGAGIIATLWLLAAYVTAAAATITGANYVATFAVTCAILGTAGMIDWMLH